MHRAVAEFSTLQDARFTRFTQQGSGNATVVTPGRYRRGASYAIAVHSRDGTRHRVQRADGHGKLDIAVVLGPSNTMQEYAVDGTTLGATVYTTSVTIARLAG